MNEPLTSATSSGVPVATILPPRFPPSGPKSTTQSADFMTSKWCSITMIECPVVLNLSSTSINCCTSENDNPLLEEETTNEVIQDNNGEEEDSNDLKEFGVDSDSPDLFSSEGENSSPEDLLSSDEEEEDDLEIPAFLRRQKN